MVFNKNADDSGSVDIRVASGARETPGIGGPTREPGKGGARSTDTEGKRPYRLKARAKRQEEVHRRITQAAVDLHGTVGPARTTVSEIAKRAGVRRATVYNHFPTDLELIDACSSHWLGANPPPDPAGWAGIADPARRTESALAAMYDYYDRSRDMLENVLRDAALIPALDEINHRKFWPALEQLGEMLADAWGDAATTELRATIATVLDFFTWQTLAGRGLSPDAAATLATRWVAASAGD